MLNSREKMLFVWPVLFVVAVPVACKTLNRGDRLDKDQRSLAGAQAIDCGTGRIKTDGNKLVLEDRASADACAAAAFEAKKPFFVRYDTEAEEELGTQSLGIMRTPQGQVRFTNYMYYPGWYQHTAQYVSAMCPAPALITHFGKRGKQWKQVGCSSCSAMGSDDTADCIFQPLKP